jgi:hypothetical protein
MRSTAATARLLLPVLAAPLAREEDIWLFLRDFKRVEAPGYRPYPPAEAAKQLLVALGLATTGRAAPPLQPNAIAADEPSGGLDEETRRDRVDDLLARAVST